MPNLYPLLRRLLFALNEEHAHRLTMGFFNALGRVHPINVYAHDAWRGPLMQCPIKVMGIDFPNPVGLAAGLDKDARAVDGLAALGFGFIEVGTVTPLPQAGNPHPRLFRLSEHGALINRNGFNSAGLGAFLSNLARHRQTVRIGINLGKNAVTPIRQAADDYLTGLRAVYRAADYVSINISSPNTTNLRSLEKPLSLDPLLRRLTLERSRLSDLHGRYVPLAVKLSPDLDSADMPAITTSLLQNKVDAVIATNTTIARPESIQSHFHAKEAGGLSGKPLFDASTELVVNLHHHLQGEIPIIAAGGIFSGDDAWRKLAAGASLIQIYTGFIYRGPRLIRDIIEKIHRQQVGRNFTDLASVLESLHGVSLDPSLSESSQIPRSRE
ncbi:MAG: dihydroorotate dehydrogenase (quinone) [Acidiferrobacteraceae bacterium]|nr:dihydroorotate dehydrogenase (quinone) [Acidiferrobacteraceae bacterium]